MLQLYDWLYTDTVDSRYNAVLGLHRSDPRYIRVDGYNAVCSPHHAADKWPVSPVDRLILSTYLLYKLPYFANMLVQKKKNYIFCFPILTSIKSYLVFSSTETYYQIRQAVILFVDDTAEYCYVIDCKRTNEYTGWCIFR